MTRRQIVKGIDAVSREQLVQIIAFLGIGNVTPVFSLVPSLGPFRTAALLPTITEEDKVILNNVQKIVQFLAAGSAAPSNQVMANSWLFGKHLLMKLMQMRLNELSKTQNP